MSCAHFLKQDAREKGDECEFSHDLNVAFNQGNMDIYTDLRDVKNKMDNEVNKIAEEKEKKRSKVPQSNIICKFFLDAVQRKVYGWKWECPNGDECHYKHCLPKGYVITTNKDKMQEEMSIDDYINLEEQIDSERERISKSGTPVNDNTFIEWKKKRDAFRKQGKEDEEKKRKFQTGIQLFKSQVGLFKDDENAEDTLEREEEKMAEESKGEDNTQNNDKVFKTEKEILDDLENELKGVKINTELFQNDENLDDLDAIEEEDNEANDEQKNKEIIEEEK